MNDDFHAYLGIRLCFELLISIIYSLSLCEYIKTILKSLKQKFYKITPWFTPWLTSWFTPRFAPCEYSYNFFLILMNSYVKRGFGLTGPTGPKIMFSFPNNPNVHNEFKNTNMTCQISRECICRQVFQSWGSFWNS